LVLLLIAAGGLGLWGASFAYPTGVAVSAIALSSIAYAILVSTPHPFLSQEVNLSAVGVALGLFAVIGNILAVRDKGTLSEQANPMNLPVFG
jgi:hypothetical protein